MTSWCRVASHSSKFLDFWERNRLKALQKGIISWEIFQKGFNSFLRSRHDEDWGRRKPLLLVKAQCRFWPSAAFPTGTGSTAQWAVFSRWFRLSRCFCNKIAKANDTADDWVYFYLKSGQQAASACKSIEQFQKHTVNRSEIFNNKKHFQNEREFWKTHL